MSCYLLALQEEETGFCLIYKVPLLFNFCFCLILNSVLLLYRFFFPLDSYHRVRGDNSRNTKNIRRSVREGSYLELGMYVCVCVCVCVHLVSCT